MYYYIIESEIASDPHSYDSVPVHNVDEVLERHNDFLESCLGDCMLTSPQLLKAVTALCLAGCGGSGATSSGSADSFSRSVARYGLRFTAALLSALAIIERMARENNTNKLLNISARGRVRRQRRHIQRVCGLVLAVGGALRPALHGRAAVRARHHRAHGAREQHQQTTQHLCQVTYRYTLSQGAGCGGSGATSSGSADSFSRSVARYGLRFTTALLSALAIIKRMAREKNTNKLINISASGATCSGSSDSFSRSVARYGLRFKAALLSALAIIERMARENNTNKLLNISARLKFNTYYAKQLEKLCADENLLDGDRKSAS
ncbi:Gamma-tubulin ring protein 84, isoform E [Operophtera brumata]|uniref:Gamma-tubulin ring protein 84, isoform E n=1 Tax=Operophtera brumata TaxID=104452 RepID=A0A0L7KTL8_OPEBR|nr:Gamma-tubulin ring protein 84, isoform E [Operophtera brumata]